MKNSSTFRVISDCFRKNRLSFILFVSVTAIDLLIFLLYNIMLEPFIYAELLLLVLFLILIITDFLIERRARHSRELLSRSILAGSFTLPEARSFAEDDLYEIIRTLTEEIERKQTELSAMQRDADDYYTVWVHEIKTPISVMKLRLTDGSEENRDLLQELFRIEQYVDMALSFIRLGSSTNDLVVKEYSLDEIIRESVRKFASAFVARKLRLVYEPAVQNVVTGKKWLGFIIEQILSNALKYTPSGEIRIDVSENLIRISDTGIGIAPEDLPLIFEKGYTGVILITNKK